LQRVEVYRTAVAKSCKKTAGTCLAAFCLVAQGQRLQQRGRSHKQDKACELSLPERNALEETEEEAGTKPLAQHFHFFPALHPKTMLRLFFHSPNGSPPSLPPSFPAPLPLSFLHSLLTYPPSFLPAFLPASNIANRLCFITNSATIVKAFRSLNPSSTKSSCQSLLDCLFLCTAVPKSHALQTAFAPEFQPLMHRHLLCTANSQLIYICCYRRLYNKVLCATICPCSSTNKDCAPLHLHCCALLCTTPSWSMGNHHIPAGLPYCLPNT
jgi:hypothetical protein